jgi:tetratricopeptide (TPR) repeat protein
MATTDPTRPADRSSDKADRAHWEAVEEVAELLHEERFHDALGALRDVLRANAKNPYAFHFLGIALFETGQVEAARDAYKACLRLAPEHLGARVALSHVLRQLGDLRGALKEGVQALSQAPGDGDAMHSIGLAHVARADYASARKYLEAALETNPDFEMANEIRAVLSELPGGAPAVSDPDDEDA